MSRIEPISGKAASSKSVRLGLLAFSSATLLVLSFPRFNQSWCAWIALVPWLMLLNSTSPRAAFFWSYGIGLLFFLGSIWWLTYVTIPGWIILSAYLAVYFGLFGWCVLKLSDRSLQTAGNKYLLSDLWSLLIVPAAWVSLEYIRANIFSGFGWNLLGYSQTSWIQVIQHADITGVWGVSFLVVLSNVAIARFLMKHVSYGEAVRGVFIFLIIMGVVLGYGYWQTRTDDSDRNSARIAVVQGNIPQELKWDETYLPTILNRYELLTQEAAATDPDLIVWPETSVPALLGIHEKVTQRIRDLAQSVNLPLLVGAPMPAIDKSGFWLNNAAALIAPSGLFAGRYNKLHLVPFGEFIPFEKWLPWLRYVLPPIGDFIPGDDTTVFTIPVSSFEFRVSSPAAIKPNSKPKTQNPKLSFSVLICFEDLFPELARSFVRKGARMLIVITNDGWFGPSAAAYQHTQASTFRAVELRVPVIRAANTGWSGCIDAYGRWHSSVRNSNNQELFITGTQTCEVVHGEGKSFYLQWGDWLPGLCLVGVLSWLGLQWLTRSQGSRNPA